MKKLFNILIIFFIFSSNVFAADEIEKGKTLLKSLSKKSLTKKETISFLKEYAVIVEDERGDGKVTYIFDDDKYSRYKGTEIISSDAWRFSKLGALRLFNKDVKMTWKIKISDKENLINIKTKFDPVGKLYEFEVKTKKEFLDQIEQIKQAKIQKKEAIEKAKIKKKKKIKQEKLAEEQKRKEEERKLEEEKKKLEEERLAAEQKLEEEKRKLKEERLAAEQKLEEEKRKLEEERLVLQKELEELKKKKAEELEQSKKTPTQIKKEERERLKQEKLDAEKKAREKKERLKQEKLAAEKKAKDDKLFNSVFNAKWGMKGIPCDLNGGAYHQWTTRGFMFWAGGKLQDSGGMSLIEADEVIKLSSNRFLVTQRYFPTRKNKIMFGAVGSKMSAEIYETYTIENEDLLSVKREIKMLDIDAILNGYKGDQVGYTYKTENVERVRCK